MGTSGADVSIQPNSREVKGKENREFLQKLMIEKRSPEAETNSGLFWSAAVTTAMELEKDSRRSSS